MNRFDLPYIKGESFSKVSFTEEDMDTLIENMMKLRMDVMRNTGVELSGIVLPAKDFLLFKNGTQFLTKYRHPMYIEMRSLIFCGIPILCGGTNQIVPLFSDKDAMIPFCITFNPTKG